MDPDAYGFLRRARSAAKPRFACSGAASPRLNGSVGGLRPPTECRLRAPRAIGLAGEADAAFAPPAAFGRLSAVPNTVRMAFI